MKTLLGDRPRKACTGYIEEEATRTRGCFAISDALCDVSGKKTQLGAEEDLDCITITSSGSRRLGLIWTFKHSDIVRCRTEMVALKVVDVGSRKQNAEVWQNLATRVVASGTPVTFLLNNMQPQWLSPSSPYSLCKHNGEKKNTRDCWIRQFRRSVSASFVTVSVISFPDVLLQRP